jgi:uncharacterized MAPEG superfamily protein
MNTTLHVARFTAAYWCVLIAVLLPLGCSWLAKSGQRGKSVKEGGFDRHDPRGWMARQTDWRARANAAQANSFEALPFFIGAVVIAHLLGAGQTLLDMLAFLYVMLRVFYILMYVSDMPMVRSTVWAAAFVVNIAILFVGYR